MSQTVTYERPYDHVYDPNYVLSSQRDHAKVNTKAQMSSHCYRRMPIFPNMFTDLRHYPRSEVRLDMNSKNHLPASMTQQWPGHAQQARQAIMDWVKFGGDKSVLSQLPAKVTASVEVEGRDRFRFFRRPIIPYTTQIQPDIVMAVNPMDNKNQLMMMAAAAAASDDRLDGETGRPLNAQQCHVATQTMYRDSEAQTDPYTPEYVVKPGEGSMPELLSLATLSYGRGLPAGLQEVEMIERARRRRRLEAELPPLHDLSQMERRRQMMDAMEREEWANREQQIEMLQEARIQVLINLLHKREENHQKINVKKLDRLWAKKQKEKEKQFQNIRFNHIRELRKLLKSRANIEQKHQKREIIHDYVEASSATWAPLTRVGQFLDRGSEQFAVRNRYLNTYAGLLELEQSIPQFVLEPRIVAPRANKVTKAGFVKRSHRQEQELAELSQHIADMKELREQPKKPLRFLEKIEKPIPRPPTPTVETPSQEMEEEERSIILLQKMIRGRAVQAMMYESKEKRIELIKELRSTHALQAQEAQMKKEEKVAILSMQRQRLLLDHREEAIDKVLSELDGDCIGTLLDFLAKELVRLQQERKIHAFAMLAERQRRIREAEESGLRQVEERRRREEDEIFKQMMKVQQQSVEEFLQATLADNIDWSSDTATRAELEKEAQQINEIAYDLEENRTNLQTEETVADMVHFFLIPEVYKSMARDQIKAKQRSVLLGVHQNMVNAAKDTWQGVATENASNTQANHSNTPPPNVESSSPPLPQVENDDKVSSSRKSSVATQTPRSGPFEKEYSVKDEFEPEQNIPENDENSEIPKNEEDNEEVSTDNIE